MDIAEFIAARLDEDKELAQDVARGNPGPWSIDSSWIRDAAGETVVHDEYRWGGAVFEHIARHDPARVLREIAAKRAIVAAHAEVAYMDRDDPEPEYAYGRAAGLGEAVRQLAATWNDHQDYRQEWAP